MLIDIKVSQISITEPLKLLKDLDEQMNRQTLALGAWSRSFWDKRKKSKQRNGSQGYHNPFKLL